MLTFTLFLRASRQETAIYTKKLNVQSVQLLRIECDRTAAVRQSRAQVAR